MNSKIFILKISDIIELGCRFLVQYICREMLINAYEVFCPSVPVCIKIVDGGARRRRRAVCAVPFSNTTVSVWHQNIFLLHHDLSIILYIAC